jgi:hypothetical protein
MGLFGLGPEQIAFRVRGGGMTILPSLWRSVLRGVIGFTIVSVAGFAPWAVFGGQLHRAVGEAGMYAACAVVFIVLSGILLHPLIIGPGSLWRFYVVFGLAFTLYSAAWTVAWMKLHGGNAHTASLVGLFAGTALMGVVLTIAFEALSALPVVVLSLFVLNTAGYYAGDYAHAYLRSLEELKLFGVEFDKSGRNTLAMLSWGACYGAGMGAGLGIAFWRCQSQVRGVLADR